VREGQWRKRRRATVRRAKETIPSVIRNGDTQKPSTKEDRLSERDGEQRRGNKARTERQIKRSSFLERKPNGCSIFFRTNRERGSDCVKFLEISTT